jgi:putative phosphoesterase
MVEAYFFLGDLFGYYPFVNECLALWPEVPLWAVRGNHDQVLVDCLEDSVFPSDDYQERYGSALTRALRVLQSEGQRVIQDWPLEQTLTLKGFVIQFVHGAPWDPLEGRVYPDFKDWDRFVVISADIIVLGHTHYPFVKEYAGKLIINPGSVGQARDRSGAASCALLDLDNRQAKLLRVHIRLRHWLWMRTLMTLNFPIWWTFSLDES